MNCRCSCHSFAMYIFRAEVDCCVLCLSKDKFKDPEHQAKERKRWTDAYNDIKKDENK